MNSETKLFAGIIAATFAIIVGAAFFFSRPTNAPKVDPKLLVAEDSYKFGSPSATVTLVEFGDFQCPACGAYHLVVKQLLDKYKDSLALVFRHFPLNIHPNAMPASIAVEAAGKQGKFWEMYNKVYETQSAWSTEKDTVKVFSDYAGSLGLNVEQFTKDLEDSSLRKKIERDMADAAKLGINSTPSFYLNNERIQNPASLEDFETLIKAAILKAPKPEISSEGAYHAHANIRVLVDGAPVDFSLPKYQSKEGAELNEFIHFHDGVGNMFHIHKKGMTLLDLFSSLKMKLSRRSGDSKGQLVEDTGRTSIVRLFVNGKENAQFDAYVPEDLDKILITTEADDAAVTKQLTSVADDACIYSEKCPERGTPPTEECVGGLGTDCK